MNWKSIFENSYTNVFYFDADKVKAKTVQAAACTYNRKVKTKTFFAVSPDLEPIKMLRVTIGDKK